MRYPKRVVATAGAAAILLAAPAASADPYVHCQEAGPSAAPAGAACFSGYGDRITVLDTLADGYRVVGDWQTDYGRSGECHNVNGADSVPVTRDYSMREDSGMRFRARTRDGRQGIDHACSYWTEWMNIG
ncbi:hypothetical protein ACL02R_13835 [Streptomyces sp. MS19]|uniref:hypothetical protein n=1 Tax=Streptomyces sp. MS19 TaxID=3385972 RepID=UPI0039A2F9E4